MGLRRPAVMTLLPATTCNRGSQASVQSHTPLVGSTILYKLILQDWWYSWCLPYSATREVKTQASVQSHTLLHYNSCSTLLIYVQACSLKTLSNSYNTMFHSLLFEDTSQLACYNSCSTHVLLVVFDTVVF